MDFFKTKSCQFGVEVTWGDDIELLTANEAERLAHDLLNAAHEVRILNGTDAVKGEIRTFDGIDKVWNGTKWVLLTEAIQCEPI